MRAAADLVMALAFAGMAASAAGRSEAIGTLALLLLGAAFGALAVFRATETL